MVAASGRIVIAGTGTEIGKTWTAVQLLLAARALGLRVAVRKPAQSYAAADGATDSDLLAAASGETSHAVCPASRWYPVPMAPPMAADVLGRAPIHIEQLLAETTWPSDVAFTLLETAGGLCSPIAHDADNLELIYRLQPNHVILVADAGLGTISAVRLCLKALGSISTIVFLNRFDPGNDLHRRNAAWLRAERESLATSVQQLLELLTR
jgi:dethiobiotin synthetase